MDATAVIGKTLEYNANFVQTALDGLPEADLMKRPSDHSNPIGWLIWHQSCGGGGILAPQRGGRINERGRGLLRLFPTVLEKALRRTRRFLERDS